MGKIIIKDEYDMTMKLLNSTKISFKAKGLFCYLRFKPDGWKATIDKICHQAKEGKDSIRSALQELEKFGYLQRIPVKDDQGKFAGHNYILKEPEDVKRIVFKTSH